MVASPLRVLVIDDTEAIGRAIRRLLREHDVQCVTSARAAMALLTSERPPFDAVLCDLHMPDEGGIEFLAMLGAALPELAPPVILMSGDPEAASLAGVTNECLAKPFSRAELLSALDRLG
jgi:CheY-like chemotaxis protein